MIVPDAYLVREQDVDPLSRGAATIAVGLAIELAGPLAAPEKLGWFVWDEPADAIGVLRMQTRESEGTTRLLDDLIQMHLLAQPGFAMRVAAAAAHEAIHCRQNRLARIVGAPAHDVEQYREAWEDEASLFFWDNRHELGARLRHALGLEPPDWAPGASVIAALGRRGIHQDP